MATSAAPTYFRYFESSWKTAYADGGLWVNNPSVVGILEATEILGCDRSHVRVLNLGTGSPKSGIGTPPWPRKLGIAGWAIATPDILLDADAIASSSMANLMLGENFVRIAPNLGSDRLPLDRYAPAALVAQAEELARYHLELARGFFSHIAPPYKKQRRNGPVTSSANSGKEAVSWTR
jgi:hypothetical protein